MRLDYAATLLFADQEMTTLWQIAMSGGSFTPLRPIIRATDVKSTALSVIFGLIGTALLAVILPDCRWPRVLVFLCFLSASAFRSSFGLGSINHGNYFWLWVGFCFCFLPAGPQTSVRGSLVR